MSWPTTSDPKTEFVTLRLTTAEDAALNAAAQVTNQSRSSLVRDAVRREVLRIERMAARVAAKALADSSDGSDGSDGSGED